MNLTKHLLKHSQDNPIDFMKPGDQWTEYEKLKYFDTLCLETIQIQKKVSDYEKKCFLLEDKLRQFPVQPTFEKSVRPSDRKEFKSEQKHKHVGREGSKGLYEDLPLDPSLPKGWTNARRTFSEKFGDSKNTTVYWAPDGRFAPTPPPPSDCAADPAPVPDHAPTLAPAGSALAGEMLCTT